MVTNYVLAVACAGEGSSNISSDRVTEEILYCSNQDAKNPQVAYGFKSRSPRNTPKSWLNFAAIKGIETTWKYNRILLPSFPINLVSTSNTLVE
jgi:hypothetical protein